MREHFSGGFLLAYLSVVAFIPLEGYTDELRFVISLATGLIAFVYLLIIKRKGFGNTINAVFSFFVWVISMGHWDYLLFEEWLGTEYAFLRGFVIIGYAVGLFIVWIKS